MSTETSVETPQRGRSTRLVGTVTKASAPKTVIVAVERHTLHKTYRRYIRRTKRYMAHDEQGRCKVGDHVVITESRPLSKRKRWRVSAVVKSAVGV
jgi:small subunit ribosomal protein S17